MNEIREIKGIWFLPDTPDIETAGILKYDPGQRITLELIGDLKKRTQFDEYFDNIGPFPVIHGITSEGTKISVFECYGSWTVKTYSVPLTQYSISAFVEGKHMNNQQEALFNSIEVNLAQLLHWLGKNAFEMKRTKVSNTYYHTSIEYNPDHQFDATYNIEPDFELAFNVTAISKTNFENCKIHNVATVTISYNGNALPIWDLVSRMNIFRTFLSLGLLQSIPYNYIKLNEKDGDQQVTYTYLERGEKYNLKNEPFLYNFGRVEAKMGDMLKSWYDSTEDMFPIRVHLLNAILPKPTFHSTDFMIIAFALEGFYRRFLKSNNERTGNLISAIENILIIFKDLSFIGKVKVTPVAVNDSRNYYAHLYRKDPAKQILTGVELLKLSERLKVLLVLSILKHMGLDDSEIEHCVAHSDLLTKVNSF